MLADHLLDQARELAPRIVALRRAIHAEPELGLETPLTLAKVRAELADLPLEWREGASCTGAVGRRRLGLLSPITGPGRPRGDTLPGLATCGGRRGHRRETPTGVSEK